MASKWINVKGRVRWCKVYEADEYAGAKRYVLNFYPENQKEWDVIDKAGIQLEPKDDDLGKFIRVRRDFKRTFGDDLVFFTPPKITGAVNVNYTNEKGDEIKQFSKGDTVERVGEPTLIGNESYVMLNICVYDTRQGKGHRLEAINVIDLVEYTGGNTKSDAERGDLDETEEAKKPAVEEKRTEKVEEPSVSKDLDDEIPW